VKNRGTVLNVTEIEAKSILNKSKIFDYCLNPYTGCQINCRYCYARLFMGRYSGHREPWGQFVDVKINAPEVLRRQIKRAKRGTIWISSVCDPYQPLEKRYGITRSCLEVLLERQFPVNIQTKSDLVLCDMELLKEFDDIEVGFTITTDREEVARLFEPGASSVKDRLKALETLHKSGIKTFVFVGPVLPGDPENLIERLEGKVDRVLIDRMNYLSSIKRFYFKSGLEEYTSESFFQQYRDRMISEMDKRTIEFETLF